MMQRSSDLVVQQDTQEIPELPLDEETSMSSAEDELMEMHAFSLQNQNRSRRTFPPDCLHLVRLMKGNSACVDCQGYDDISGIMVEPMYASVTHGTLHCRQCSTGHRERDERVSSNNQQ